MINLYAFAIILIKLLTLNFNLSQLIMLFFWNSDSLAEYNILSTMKEEIPLPQWLHKLSPVLLKSEFSEDPEKPCRVIVEMAYPRIDRILSYVEANEGKVHHEHRIMPFIVIELPYSAIQSLTLSNQVKRIWHDTKVRTMLDIAIPAVGGDKVHNLGFTGKGVTVAVIDTGIAPHPDLIYPENRIVAWKDLVNEHPSPYDDNGHGTHVSGIIAGNGIASRGKYTGMAPEAKLVGIKALDKEGSGNTSDTIAAIEWCIENQKTYNIKAINLSIGTVAQESYRTDPLCRAVSAAWNKDMAVCVAAGNGGPNPRTINTPAINPNAISVGNLDAKGTADVSDDVINESSSRGPTVDYLIKPDLLAPGTNITSLRPRWGYRSLTGTSMSTPMVTGAVTQILQKWPDLKPYQIKNLLKKNAHSFGLQPVFQGSGALATDGIFNESKKNNSDKLNILNILNILLGNNFKPKMS
jgi:serine protease AprX